MTEQELRELDRKLTDGAEWIPKSAERQYGFQTIPSMPSGKVAPITSLDWIRELYDDESDLHRMTSSAPPVTQTIIEHTEPDGHIWFEHYPEEDLAAQIGQNLSGELVALIAGIRADFVSYGPRHPIRRALAEWERSCRRRHRPPTWRDHATPICAEMLYAVVNGCSVLWCAQRWGIEYPRAARLIATGLAFVAERYVRSQDAQLGIVHDRDRCSVCQEEEQA